MHNISIFSWFGFPIPMGERFKLIKAAGFDGVMLWWSDEYAEVDGSKSLHPELARLNGLFIENIHTPIIRNNCLWKEGTDGDAFEKTILDCIDDCKNFEIPTAVVHINNGDNPPNYSHIGLDRLNRLVEAAEKNEVNIALENLRRPEYLDFIFQNINSKCLGFCYDSGHEICYTKGTDLLSQYGSKLMALHLHDNDGSEDQHLIPGEGIIKWADIKAKLYQVKYAGAIALEVTNTFSQNNIKKDPEKFLKRAYEEAKRLIL